MICSDFVMYTRHPLHSVFLYFLLLVHRIKSQKILSCIQ